MCGDDSDPATVADRSSLTRRRFLAAASSLAAVAALPGRAWGSTAPAGAAERDAGGGLRRHLAVLDGHAHPFRLQRAGRLDGGSPAAGPAQRGRRRLVDRPRPPDGGRRIPQDGALHQPDRRAAGRRRGQALAVGGGAVRAAVGPVGRRHRRQPGLAPRPGRGRQPARAGPEHRNVPGRPALLRRVAQRRLELPGQPHRPDAVPGGAAHGRVAHGLPRGDGQQRRSSGGQRPPGR